MPQDPEQGRKSTFVTDSFRERLIKQRMVLISSDINQSLAGEVIVLQPLTMANESEEPITLFLNSQGGHVESGDTIHDVIRFVRSRVRIVGTGWVASAGALIYVSVPREDRYCLPNTRFLLHLSLPGACKARCPTWTSKSVRILGMRDRLNRIFAKQTGQSLERIVEDTRRNFWLDAKGAKEYGIVGQIIESITELK